MKGYLNTKGRIRDDKIINKQIKSDSLRRQKKGTEMPNRC